MKVFKFDDQPSVTLPRSPEERKSLRYTWVEVCFNPVIASQAEQSSKDFIRGLSWYASFRWFLGNRNSFLDHLLDVEHITPIAVTKKEYSLNNRVWMKWIRKYEW